MSVNVKRVHRIWKCEKLEVVRKKLKPRRKAHGRNSVTRLKPEYSGHVWSYDFVHGRTEDGRKLRFLTVVDEFTREALAIEVGRSFGAKKVVATLRKVTLVRGFPDHLRSDNGGEFVAEVVKAWLTKAGVNTLFIDPGSPWQNAYIESFNGKFRDEFLDRELLGSLLEAQVFTEDWRTYYNWKRPHSSLNYQTPAEFAAGWGREG